MAVVIRITRETYDDLVGKVAKIEPMFTVEAFMEFTWGVEMAWEPDGGRLCKFKCEEHAVEWKLTWL